MTARARIEVPVPSAQRRLAGASITVFRSFAEAALAWQRTARSCAHYGFQALEWLETWQQTIGAAEKVAPRIVFVADRAGEPLLLLPLGIRREKTCRVLRFLGDDPTDYHAPLIERDFAAQATLAEFATLWARILEALPQIDLIDLRKMPEMIEGALNPMVRLAGTARSDIAIATPLPASFAEFAKTRSGSFFAQNRRKRRQLAALGELTFEIAQNAPARREILQAAFRQKMRRVAETGARDRLARPGYQEFYERAANRRFAAGGLHVSCLRVGEAIVAAHVGLVHAGRYYILMPTFEDGVWAKYSAGRLLIESLIDWAIAQRLDIFDFTIGDESYKRSWADTEMPLFELRAARSRKGALLLASQLGWQRLRQNARLRALLRSWRDALRGKRRIECD
ncbi:MAG TPA: GNAT family N-acetyltransferase [Stellaceae bacterium]|nr:GNAT family N-acetyltransferase [Stellaceae bacterium]